MHWTGVKLHGYLKEQLQIELGYSTTVRWLHELNFHLRVPQPWPERQNEEERKQFLEELRALCADPTVELWFPVSRRSAVPSLASFSGVIGLWMR